MFGIIIIIIIIIINGVNKRNVMQDRWGIF